MALNSIPVEGAAKLSMCHNEALFLVHSLPTNVALLLWKVSKKLESVPRNDVSLGMQSCIKNIHGCYAEKEKDLLW